MTAGDGLWFVLPVRRGKGLTFQFQSFSCGYAVCSGLFLARISWSVRGDSKEGCLVGDYSLHFCAWCQLASCFLWAFLLPGVLCSNYRAEARALLTATETVTQLETKPKKVVLLTDSLTVLQSLASGNPEDYTLRNLIQSLNSLTSRTTAILQWIPAHTSIHGNQVADQLAKEGSKKQQPKSKLSYQEAKTCFRLKFIFKKCIKETNYNEITLNIWTLNLRSPLIIDYKKYLYLWYLILDTCLTFNRNTLHKNPNYHMQLSAVQLSAVQLSAVQLSAVQLSARLNVF